MARLMYIHRKIAFSCLLASIFALFQTGCATPPNLPLNTQEGHYVSQNPKEKGTLFFYWEFGIWAIARGIYINANGRRIGGLNRGSYFCYEADPGEITISVEDWLRKDWQREDQSETIKVEAGQRYYFRARLDFGLLDADPGIEIVDNAKGAAAIKKLKYATLK